MVWVVVVGLVVWVFGVDCVCIVVCGGCFVGILGWYYVFVFELGWCVDGSGCVFVWCDGVFDMLLGFVVWFVGIYVDGGVNGCYDGRIVGIYGGVVGLVLDVFFG